MLLTYKAARTYKKIANLCPFYTTRKTLPEEINFIQYLKKKSIQILSTQIGSQNDRKKKAAKYTQELFHGKPWQLDFCKSAMIYIELQKLSKNSITDLYCVCSFTVQKDGGSNKVAVLLYYACKKQIQMKQ